MNKKTSNIILLGMITGAVLGVLGGYFFGSFMLEIKFLGTIFLNALKMIVIPLVITSMIVGVASLGDVRKLGRTAGKTITFYMVTTGFSVLVGIILVNLIRPGVGVPLVGAGVPEFVTSSGQLTVIDIIVGLIPDNIFAAAASGQILPLIVFSLIFGGVLTAIGSKGKPVISLFEGINLAIMKIVMLVIYFAPIGILALIGGIVAQNQASIDRLISALGWYAVTVIIGLLIHATITLPMILKIFGRKKPLQYAANMGQALATAFTTASSSATLPVTMECVEDKNKVDKKAASFVLPLGATINMDGTALYEAVAALFIAQIYGIDLSIGAQVIIFFTATLASVGAAAIPEAGLVMMTLVLSAVGLPLEGIGIILAIDWFLDRCRTTVNVWGDSIGAAVIAETAEIKQYLRQTEKQKPRTIPVKKSIPARSSKSRTVQSAKPGNRTWTRKPPDDHREKTRKTTDGRSRQDRPARKQERPVRKEKNERFVGKPVQTQKTFKPRKNNRTPVREPDKIPQAIVEKEIQKVKQQLNAMSEKPLEPTGKKTPDKSGSEFFENVEFSKMNLFADENNKVESTSITTDEKKERENFSALSVTSASPSKRDVSLERSMESLTDEREKIAGPDEIPKVSFDSEKADKKSAMPAKEESISSEDGEPESSFRMADRADAPVVDDKVVKDTGTETPEAPDTPTTPETPDKPETPDTSGEGSWGRVRKKRPSR